MSTMTWDEVVGIARDALDPMPAGLDNSEYAEAVLRQVIAAGLAIVPREATSGMLDAASGEYVPWSDALTAGEIKPPVEGRVS